MKNINQVPSKHIMHYENHWKIIIRSNDPEAPILKEIRNFLACIPHNEILKEQPLGKRDIYMWVIEEKYLPPSRIKEIYELFAS